MEDQKHSSAVAKVHYQKRRSREVAVKAHECLQKLQGNKGSEVDEDVKARFGGSTCCSPLSVETMEKASLSPPRKVVIPTENLRTQRRKLHRVMKFTADEDDILKQGINRHGYGQMDCHSERFGFQVSRGKNSRFSKEKGWTQNATTLTTLQTCTKEASLNVKLCLSVKYTFI